MVFVSQPCEVREAVRPDQNQTFLLRGFEVVRIEYPADDGNRDNLPSPEGFDPCAGLAGGLVVDALV